MVDVAKQAGVSYQTVSRVVNNHPNVAPRTREKILRAIQELNYLPNVTARNLVTRRTNTVGIISYGTSFFGPGQMLTNIEASLRERGYALTISTLTELNRDGLLAAIRELRSRSVDGIVMIAPTLQADVTEIRSLGGELPIVMVDVPPGRSLPSVVIDQRKGGVLAARHLLELGHTRIAEIVGPPAWTGAALRHAGMQATMAEAGLQAAASAEGDWSASSGYEATGRLLAGGAEFSAVFVSNDQMALGAIRALRERGLSVPDDISIVGFDNLPESAYFEPPLTTVRQDFVSLGRESAEYLSDLIEERDTPRRQRVIEPELVIRLSTKALVGGDDA